MINSNVDNMWEASKISALIAGKGLANLEDAPHAVIYGTEEDSVFTQQPFKFIDHRITIACIIECYVAELEKDIKHDIDPMFKVPHLACNSKLLDDIPKMFSHDSTTVGSTDIAERS